MNKREHGAHNKGLCDKLCAIGNYNDWVVTTAFYSAIHYIDHKIFPFEYKGQEIKSLDTAFKNTDFSRGNRHDTRAFLVKEKLPLFSTEFRYLMDRCFHARYNNYKVAPAVASNVRLFLDTLISECDQDK